MMGANNSVMTRFQTACPGIYISKCICHSLHICASNASKMLPRQCEDLVKDIYNFFKQSAKRKSMFAKFQEIENIQIYQILHPAQTRWLSFQPAVNRILEQWDALHPFFVEFNNKESFERAERIFIPLSDLNMKMYYQFLNWVLPKFDALNALKYVAFLKNFWLAFRIANIYTKPVWIKLILFPPHTTFKQMKCI